MSYLPRSWAVVMAIQYGEFAEVAVQLMAYMQREEQIMAQMETLLFPIFDKFL